MMGKITGERAGGHVRAGSLEALSRKAGYCLGFRAVGNDKVDPYGAEKKARLSPRLVPTETVTLSYLRRCP